MEANRNKPLNAVLLVAAIAFVAFCVTGVAALMGWLPAGFGGAAGLQQIPAPNVIAVVPGCGVIEALAWPAARWPADCLGTTGTALGAHGAI